MKKVLIKTACIITFIIVFGGVWEASTSPKTSTESSFNAIDLVKAKIPSNTKNRMWYIEKWSQEKIDGNTWKVYVSDGIWKVSKSNNLCSETGKLVTVCSVNGTAKRYSNLGFCKPLFICENKQLNVSNINIAEELKKIDLSKLSYSKKEKDGWKYTEVNGIPETLRRAIFYQTAKYERENQDAVYSETVQVLAKRYGLPGKAVGAIYNEGIPKKWSRY